MNGNSPLNGAPSRWETDVVTSHAPVVADGDRTRVSPQGYFYRGPFGLLAEHVLSSQAVRRSTAEATLHNSAWQLAGRNDRAEPHYRRASSINASCSSLVGSWPWCEASW